ncbi:MAG: DUF1580 domain-containing protein [Planctomycetes bacterium]|nr:DUF1580 domain-containing protein [Planctomycetota bacterium]
MNGGAPSTQQHQVDNQTSFDSYLTLGEASRLLPGRPTPTSLWRWSRKGLSGVKLRTIRISRKIYTTQDWLNEFFEAVDRADRKRWESEQRDNVLRSSVEGGCHGG